MSVITKDLGIATAYGYAKSKGYTGTEEEFAELMASYADVAQQAEAAAQDAEDAKDEAVTAKTDAQTAKTAAQAAQSASETASGAASTKASEAAQSAQAASGSATAAQTSATAAAGSAQTAQAAAQTATTKASEASSSASAASTAKTGAETARTGAQTAQTAAETAQANAEAAASSVSASAAQIEQNTEDITGLKNDFIDTFDVTLAPNLLDINSVVDGYIRENGSVTVTGAWKTSGFIPVEYGYIYTLSYTYSDARAKHPVYFRLEYDENKNIISGTYASNGTNGYTPASSGAKFVRFSFEWVNDSSEWCFVKGTSIEYSVFGDKSFTLKEDANSSAVNNVVSAVDIINRRNLFDKEKVVAGYIKNAHGEIGITGDWVTTDYMPVEYGKQYWCSNNDGSAGIYFVLELNESMVPIYYTSQLQTQYYTPTAETVKYVRFSQSSSYIPTMTFEEASQISCIYTPYGKELLPIYRNTLYGKKWVAVGDSLTEKNVSAISNYTDFITVQNNMTLVNMGTGGTGYMRGYDADRAFYQRVANIPDCDIITIFGSGNDLAYYSDLGDVADATTATICGCINETLDVIFENHPTTPLLVIAPTPWAGNTPDMATGMSVYCEKLSAICAKRGVAYLDLFHHSGLRPDDDNQNSLVFYDGSLDGHSDFVHPNKLGHSIIAPRIMQAMESVMQLSL